MRCSRLSAVVVGWVALGACATAPKTPAAPAAPKDVGQIRAAEIAHDAERLEALAARGPLEPAAAAALAEGLYWTRGLPAATPALRGVCDDARRAPDAAERQRACAVLAFDTAAQGQPLTHLAAGGEGPFLANQKLFIALVSVEGRPAEPFIVDTGAPTTVIAKRYADRVGLTFSADVVRVEKDAAGHAVRLHPVLLRELRWGFIAVERVPAYVLDLPENFKVGGILAPQDALGRTPFEFDGPARVLRTHAGASAAPWQGTQTSHRAPLRWSGGNFFVDTRAAGLPTLPFLLDSGAGANGVCQEALDRHGAPLDGGTAALSGVAGGTQAVRTGLEGAFAVADEPARPSTLFASSCAVDPDALVEKQGYVGAPWFWARRVFFPADRRAVEFTTPDAGSP